METPPPYENGTDFGIAFMCDFDLYPNPYRYVDSLMSIIGKFPAISCYDFSLARTSSSLLDCDIVPL
jgi:hypothetical protein